jgi:anti-anti-sigma factor
MQQDIQSVNPSPSPGPNRAGYLTFTVDHRDHEVRWLSSANSTFATQELLGRVAADALQPPVRALLLDLDGVGFCDAAGVTALIRLHRAATQAEIRLVLTGLRPQVRRVLDLTGTSALIPIAYARPIGRTTVDSPNTESADRAAPPGDVKLPVAARTCRIACCRPATGQRDLRPRRGGAGELHIGRSDVSDGACPASPLLTPAQARPLRRLP